LMGPHAVGIGRRVRAHRAVAGDLPRHRHQPHRVRHQPFRRRVARHPRSAAAFMTALLEVESLGTWFYTRQGIVKAVDGIDFQVASGETLAIVGESGCGKSMTALSLMRLIPDPPGRIVSGTVKLAGRDLLQLSEEEMRGLRGNDISMIFQEPMTSLNPVMT